MDAPRLARYPFLPEARELLEAEGPPLGRLLEARAWDSAQARGRDRVQAALEREPPPDPAVASDHEALVHVLGYIVARLLVSTVDDDLLTNWYATSEAEQLRASLVDDPDDVLLAVGQELDVPVTPTGESYRVPFDAYLRASRELSALEWKLVNRTMDAGAVLLDRLDVCRLLQEALRLRLIEELPLDTPPSVAEGLAPWPESVRARLNEIRSSRQELDMEEVEPDAFPPCINSLIASIKAGENVSHEGRFAVVSFLNTVGMDRGAIINELFPNVPDFAKEITEYQVDHITGKKGKEAYTPPGCSSMQTYGLCPMMARSEDDWDDWCDHEKMNHPLTYYRWGLFVKDQREGDPSDGGAGDEDPSPDEGE